MGNLMVVNLDGNLCRTRKKKVLKSGKCKWLLPVNIVDYGSSCKAIYDTTGYRRLSSFEEIGAADILDVLKKSLECADDLKDFLFFPEEYLLTAECIFISEDFTNIKIAYIPRKGDEGEKNCMSYYIFSLRKLTTTNGKLYLDALGSMLECSSIKPTRVKSIIDEMRIEIRMCGIS